MSTVTRAGLAEHIYTQVGLSRNESAELLEAVLDRIDGGGEHVISMAPRASGTRTDTCTSGGL